MTFTLNPGQQRALTETLLTPSRYKLLYGGSRSGKSALLASCVMDRAWAAPGGRHLICRKDGTAAKMAIVKDTFPTIWKLKYPDVPLPVWRDKDGYYQMANGSEVWVGGLNDDKAVEKILGREYATIWPNELSEIKYDWHTLLRSRLAQTVKRMDGTDLPQRYYGDLNPTTRMHWTYRLWQDGVDPTSDAPVDRKQYDFSVINPNDNRDNLSGDYLADLDALPEAARKRFLLGEYVSDDENALWRRHYFKRVQLREDGSLPVDMRRIVVAIDPAGSDKAGSDETGIVAAGLGVDGRAYILSDDSGRHRSEEWARLGIASYRRWGADALIGEGNYGGDMVEAVVRAQDPNINYRRVNASVGKMTRAEPVAALYELGKVFHLPGLTDLEDQCCAVTRAFDRKAAGWSPDRVDALVWALTELFPEMSAPRMPAHIPMPEINMV